MRGLSDSICEARRQKVLSLVTALPEASAEVCGGRHLSFKVRGKTFGYFLDDHHGDGRVALNCKTASGVNDMLARLCHSNPYFFIVFVRGDRMPTMQTAVDREAIAPFAIDSDTVLRT
jgi:hypothetical protein